MRLAIIATLTVLSQAAFGLTTYVPEASVEIETHSDNASLEIPAAAFTPSNQPTEFKTGRIGRQSWRVDNLPSPDAILNAMLNAYIRQGFELNFRCQASGCGGFAFRYALELSGPPKFLVDLSNFEYMDLRNDTDIVTIFASHVDGATYINQTHIQTVDTAPVELIAKGKSISPTQNSDTRWVLGSVEFASGSSQISSQEDSELQNIATRLSEGNENVYIVGHSDQTGGLAGNLSISQSRANAVRDVLIKSFKVNPARIFAKGVAFLAPIADNNSEEGRATNRRVEAVFLQN